MNFFDQLRSLDPRDVGRWPFAVRAFFVALAFIVVTGVGWYFFVWDDDRPVLQKAEQDEQDLRTQFETKQQRAANLDAYKLQLGEMERSFGAMLRQLPGKTEVPNLLVDISQTGLAAGLQEKLFQPAAEKSNGFYAELPIHIRLVGSYHEFGNFVSGIAALPRIVTLHDITISPADNKSSGYDNLVMDVTAKTYRYIEVEGKEYPQQRGDLRGAGQPGGSRLFQRPVRFAEMDRGHQEKARRTHPTAAGSEAVRDFRVRREQHALAVSAAEPESRQRIGRAPERAA
jgi:type IV pilus assembly protein PilO